jgi:endoglycosylceramidase
MMTEWGALGNTPGAVSQVHAITGMADDSLQSWAYWQFKDFQDVTTASVGPIESFYDAQGNLQFDKVRDKMGNLFDMID